MAEPETIKPRTRRAAGTRSGGKGSAARAGAGATRTRVGDGVGDRPPGWPSVGRRPGPHRRLLARRQLPVGRADLPARQPAAARAAEPAEHVKPRLLGHWGTTPGLNFIYAHLNRVIARARPRRDLRHRSRVMAARRPVANAYLEGTYTEVYPQHHPGRGRACGSCSGSSRSRAASPATSPRRRRAPSTRAASWATRSRTPTARRSTTRDLVVACVVGDGEAETGPLAASWHSNKFLNPVTRRRGAADPAPQRLQDRQPDGAGAHPRGGAAGAASRATATTRYVVGGRRPGRRCTS